MPKSLHHCASLSFLMSAIISAHQKTKKEKKATVDGRKNFIKVCIIVSHYRYVGCEYVIRGGVAEKKVSDFKLRA